MRKQQNEPGRRAMGLPTFYGAFEELKAQCVEYDRYWDENTLEQYTGILKSVIIPKLDHHDLRPIHDYTKEEFDQLWLSLQKTGNEPMTVQRYWHITRTIITVAALNCLCTDWYEDEDVQAEAEKGDSVYPREFAVPPRSMSAKQEILVEKYLQEHLEESGAITGLWLMYICGLRNAEACGAHFGSIRELAQHPGYYVLEIPETVKSGQRKLNLGGKTYNTARQVFLPTEAVHQLWKIRDKRIRKLQKQGKTIPEKLPIACSKEDPTERCRSTDLTMAARQMFLAIGMRKKNLNDLAKELWMDQDRAKNHLSVNDGALVEREPTAYLLRRHFATMLEILNFSDSEKQYLMGHRIEDPGTLRSDYLDEELMWEMIQKMMYRPLLGSLNEEINVDRGVSGIFRNRQTIHIPAGVARISLSITALEPEASMKITVKRTGETQIGYGVRYQRSGRQTRQPMYIDGMIRRLYGNGGSG